MAEAPASGRAKVWDLPVRLIHWSFAVLLPGLWWTGEDGDLSTHTLIGYVLLALVLFRLVWGVIGTSTARFATFVRGPVAIARYLRGERERSGIGHNPLGALSVIALLLLLSVQIGFGLFAQDIDGIESGPLTYLVDYDTADWAREMHHLVFNLLLGMIVLHLAAILYYRLVKREDLVTPMITGEKPTDGQVEAIAAVPAWRAMALALAVGAVAWWVSLGAPIGSG